ncbi:hypothetical protein SAM19_03078 [Brevibacillus laterosporus]|nr:hypothetical protein [Brevibacillus laterosporus]
MYRNDHETDCKSERQSDHQTMEMIEMLKSLDMTGFRICI